MNSVLYFSLIVIQCAMSGHKPYHMKARDHHPKQYGEVNKWQTEKPNKWQTEKPQKWQTGKPQKWQSPKAQKWNTEKPTEDPTADPTKAPTLSFCPSNGLNPKKSAIEYVFLVDNSCGLSEDECNVQMAEIADTFLQIKCDKDPYFTKVAYIEYQANGAKTLISFDDGKYQKDAEKFYEFILEEAGCGKGGDGRSDAVEGLRLAVNEYLKNGAKDEDEPKRKIVMFNNCENTGYGYDDDEDVELFEDVMDRIKDIEYFSNAPDLMIINVPSQDKPAKNAISDPYDYLAFLIGDRSSRKPSPSQLYVAPERILNDGEITSADFEKAALVEDGSIVNRDDVYLNDHRLLEFVGEPNTMLPTIDPTEFPTTYPTSNPTENPTENPTSNPTEVPTADPTEPKKVCFYVDYQMKDMVGSKRGNRRVNGMPSWNLYRKGSKRPVQSGRFKGMSDKKCVYIEYPQREYTVRIKRGSDRVRWYVDNEECGQCDFDEYDERNNKQPKIKQSEWREFALRCPKYTKHSKW